MKCFAVLATLAVLSVADAGRRFRQQRPRFQVEPVNGQADGQSAGSITSGISETPFELSQIDMSASSSAGQTSGLGSISINTANTNLNRLQTLQGVSQSADTNSNSVQDTQGGFVFRPIGFPRLPQPVASGNAGGLVTTDLTEGQGGFTRITSVSSNAAGSAANGGSSINSGNASNKRTETAQGVQETTNTDSLSVQRT